ncbi:uncharacterized protein LOC144163016 [Haemaphysalis longicornis]
MQGLSSSTQDFNYPLAPAPQPGAVCAFSFTCLVESAQVPVPPGPNGRLRQPNADSGLESLGSSLGSSAPLHKLVLQEEEETPGLRKEMAGAPQDVKHQSFYIISFNILCEYYPLEIGLIEYTNAWSSMRSLHTLIEQVLSGSDAPP